jgi:hypothetical protein
MKQDLKGRDKLAYDETLKLLKSLDYEQIVDECHEIGDPGGAMAGLLSEIEDMFLAKFKHLTSEDYGKLCLTIGAAIIASSRCQTENTGRNNWHTRN